MQRWFKYIKYYYIFCHIYVKEKTHDYKLNDDKMFNKSQL